MNQILGGGFTNDHRNPRVGDQGTGWTYHHKYSNRIYGRIVVKQMFPVGCKIIRGTRLPLRQSASGGAGEQASKGSSSEQQQQGVSEG